MPKTETLAQTSSGIVNPPNPVPPPAFPTPTATLTMGPDPPPNVAHPNAQQQPPLLEEPQAP